MSGSAWQPGDDARARAALNRLEAARAAAVNALEAERAAHAETRRHLEECTAALRNAKALVAGMRGERMPDG